MSDFDLSTIEEQLGYTNSQMQSLNEVNSQIRDILLDLQLNSKSSQGENIYTYLERKELEQTELHKDDFKLTDEHIKAIQNGLDIIYQSSVSSNEIMNTINLTSEDIQKYSETTQMIYGMNVEVTTVIVCGMGLMFGAVLAMLVGRWFK